LLATLCRYMILFKQGGARYGRKIACSGMFAKKQKDLGSMDSQQNIGDRPNRAGKDDLGMFGRERDKSYCPKHESAS
jgi:hypothetical protein